MVDDVQRFNVFERRARRYALPLLMSPEEAVKAAAKSIRNPERFHLSSQGDDTTSGLILPLKTAFVFDVARMIDNLPQPSQAIYKLYFVARRPSAKYCTGDECQTCQQHYGNEQVARDLCRYGYHLTAHQIGQYKQHATAGMAAQLWPWYFRRMKNRKMRV
jgi:hypothetical protein